MIFRKGKHLGSGSDECGERRTPRSCVIHRPDSPRKIDALPCDRRRTADGAYLGRLLGQLGGIVDIVGSLSDDRQALGNFKYDLAILNRMLPEGDDLDIVMALSQLPERPAFIMLTAKDAEEDVIDGLNSGADDISWLEASGSRTGDCEYKTLCRDAIMTIILHPPFGLHS